MGEHIVKHGGKVVVYSFLYKDGEHQIGNEDPVYCDYHDNLSSKDNGKSWSAIFFKKGSVTFMDTRSHSIQPGSFFLELLFHLYT